MKTIINKLEEMKAKEEATIININKDKEVILNNINEILDNQNFEQIELDDMYEYEDSEYGYEKMYYPTITKSQIIDYVVSGSITFSEEETITITHTVDYETMYEDEDYIYFEFEMDEDEYEEFLKDNGLEFIIERRKEYKSFMERRNETYNSISKIRRTLELIDGIDLVLGV